MRAAVSPSIVVPFRGQQAGLWTRFMRWLSAKTAASTTDQGEWTGGIRGL
mgnify:CR=1 FL=1